MGLRYRLATIIAPKGKRQEYSLTSGLSGNKTGAEGWAFYPNRTLLTKQCGTLEKQLQDIGANTVWVSWWVGRIARG
jgi:hypothetical protein